jgi:hypothetical protein
LLQSEISQFMAATQHKLHTNANSAERTEFTTLHNRMNFFTHSTTAPEVPHATSYVFTA